MSQAASHGSKEGDMSQAASGIQVATPCYFMVIDILGFSQITKNLKGDELAQRMIDWWTASIWSKRLRSK